MISYNPVIYKHAVFFFVFAEVSVRYSYDVTTNLIFVTSETAALHGAGVEVALVVKLVAGQTGVQLVEDGRQAASQRKQLGAGAVEADTHGALQGQAASVTQQ